MFKGYNVPTHVQRIAQLQYKYQHEIDNGTFRPYVYPLGSFGAFLVILYFLIDHRKRPWLRRLRFVVWSLNLIFSLNIILNYRVRIMPIDYGVGLITWWFVLWTTAVMVAHGGQVEFARIERTEGATRTTPITKQEANGVANGKASPPEKIDRARFSWQVYPSTMLERIDWVFDVLSNFRGMSWNWRIRSLPSPPRKVQEALKATDDNSIKHFSRPMSTQPVSKDELLRSARNWFLIGYFVLDFIRTIMVHDPYFRGLVTYLGRPQTIPYLPAALRDSPAFLQAYRLLIGLNAVYWALATIFQLAPLFFCGLLGHELIGVRGEAWMYPREWGSYISVLDRGLAGWWGVWWHQTFRFAFEAPSKRLTEVLDVDRRSVKGRALQLFVAFALSGTLHASGSHTSIGDTRPFRGPFMFFILQPFGILGQAYTAKILQRVGVTSRTPRVIRRLMNFVVVHTWFFYVAPLLIDDLAAGGTFLYEPVPFSIFRLLGLGGRNASFICWSNPLKWFHWHKGDVWWRSGLAI